MSSLVSVVIATYNSSEFIHEALESILKQTWNELELIITDDCSKDDTTKICCEWLRINGLRFERTKLLTSKINTGVSANANRGLYESKGEWIKFLGADDTLKPDCIELNMQWISDKPYIKALFSRIEIYNGSFEPKNLITISPGIPYSDDGLMSKNRSSESQYKMLLTSDRIHFTPSAFLNRSTIINIGGFDERFRLLEDYPLWLNLTRNGNRLYFMEKVTVNYRKHLKSLNNNSYVINPRYFELQDFRNIYIYPNLPVELKLGLQFDWLVLQIFRCKQINRDNKFGRTLLSIVTIYLNPFKYYVFIKKQIFGNLKHSEFYA